MVVACSASPLAADALGHVRPALLQPNTRSVFLTHSRPLDLHLHLEYHSGKDGASTEEAVYLGHGNSRTVFALPCGRALKLAALECQDNRTEAEAFGVFGALGLTTKVYGEGVVTVWSREGAFQKSLSGLIVEKADETLRCALERAASPALVFEAVRVLARCALEGLLVSDCHPGNLGVFSGTVKVIDSGNRGRSSEPWRKSDVNVKVIKPFWSKLEKIVAPAVMDCARRAWEGASSLQDFVLLHRVAATAAGALPTSPLSCPFSDVPPTPDVDDVPMCTESSTSSEEDETLSFTVKTGWYVDSLRLSTAHSTTLVGGSGGIVAHSVQLRPGERLLSLRVESKSGDGSGVLGRFLAIETTLDTYTFFGSHRSKGPTNKTHLLADAALGRVVGLRVVQGLLVGFAYADHRRPKPTKEPRQHCVDKLEHRPAMIVSDSTFGHSWRNDGALGEKFVGGCTVLYQNGGFFSNGIMGNCVAEKARRFRARRVLYIPMERSLPESRQAGYSMHEAAQEQLFKDTPFVRLPCLLDWADEYSKVHWSEFGDPSSQLYGAKSKLHLRPKAADFICLRITSQLLPGDFVFVVGWNALDAKEEFTQQRQVAEMMIARTAVL